MVSLVVSGGGSCTAAPDPAAPGAAEVPAELEAGTEALVAGAPDAGADPGADVAAEGALDPAAADVAAEGELPAELHAARTRLTTRARKPVTRRRGPEPNTIYLPVRGVLGQTGVSHLSTIFAGLHPT